MYVEPLTAGMVAILIQGNVIVMLKEPLIKQDIFVVNREIFSLDDPETEWIEDFHLLHFNDG